VGVVGYKVYRAGGFLATTTGISYADNGLPALTQYSYTVSAYDAAGNNSLPSASVSATTKANANGGGGGGGNGGNTDSIPPTTPTNLSVAPLSSSTITLSWLASTDNVGVTGYHVYRCMGTGCSLAAATNATTNSYADSGLSPSTSYTYAVSAYDAAGNTSPISFYARVATPAGSTTTPPNGGPGPASFALGARIQTTARINVRSSASTTGKVLGTQPRGGTGTIISGPVVANGYIWWNINYDNGVDGWSAQSYLSLVSSSEPTQAQILALIASLQAEVNQLMAELAALGGK
jgi:chitodextrinase